MQARVAWPLLVGLGAGLAALGAGPTPADKQTFLGRKAIYLSFEIIETGMREFGSKYAEGSLTDSAHRINRSVKFEVPLDMAVPGSFPQSSLPLSRQR